MCSIRTAPTAIRLWKRSGQRPAREPASSCRVRHGFTSQRRRAPVRLRASLYTTYDDPHDTQWRKPMFSSITRHVLVAVTSSLCVITAAAAQDNSLDPQVIESITGLKVTHVEKENVFKIAKPRD